MSYSEEEKMIVDLNLKANQAWLLLEEDGKDVNGRLLSIMVRVEREGVPDFWLPLLYSAMARCHWGLGDREKAVMFSRDAILIWKDFPSSQDKELHLNYELALLKTRRDIAVKLGDVEYAITEQEKIIDMVADSSQRKSEEKLLSSLNAAKTDTSPPVEVERFSELASQIAVYTEGRKRLFTFEHFLLEYFNVKKKLHPSSTENYFERRTAMEKGYFSEDELVPVELRREKILDKKAIIDCRYHKEKASIESISDFYIALSTRITNAQLFISGKELKRIEEWKAERREKMREHRENAKERLIAYFPKSPRVKKEVEKMVCPALFQFFAMGGVFEEALKYIDITRQNCAVLNYAKMVDMNKYPEWKKVLSHLYQNTAAKEGLLFNKRLYDDK